MDRWRRVFYGTSGLVLFVLALQVLSSATGSLVPVFEGYLGLVVRSDVSALGVGWISSYLFLNGSAVAAVTMVLLGSGVFSVTEAFMSIAGSRFGAAMIVIVIGLLGYIRGQNEDLRDAVSVGVLSFLLTYMVYVPAVALAYLYLRWVGLFEVVWRGSALFDAFVVMGPLVEAIVGLAPAPVVFVLSFAAIFVSLELFDRAFTDLSAERFEGRYFRFVMGNTWFAFLVGSLATLLTASVSISLGLMVPLYNRRYLQRRQLVPYIMGANIMTLTDTALAAAALGSGQGFNLVLLLGAAVTLVTLAYLLVYDRVFGLLKLVFDRVMTDRRFLAVFVLTLSVVPLVLATL